MISLDRDFYKNFSIGIALTGLFYTSTIGYIWVNAPSTLQNLEEKLASQVIEVVQPVNLPTPEFHEPEDHTPKSHHDDHHDTGHNAHVDQNEAHETSHTIEDQTHISRKDDKPHKTNVIEAPIEGLYEIKNDLKLPIIRKIDGLTSFEAYRAEYDFPPAPLPPLIAVVIEDFGLSHSLSTQIIDAMPAEVTFIASPYADDLDHYQEHARAAGHEVWLELPAEDKKFPYSDSGALGLLSRQSLSDNRARYEVTLAQTSGYAGVSSHLGDAFSRAKPVVTALLRESFGRGLGYFEQGTQGQKYIKSLATRMNAPFAQTTMNLNDSHWITRPDEALAQLERIAKARRFAVLTLKPYPKLLENLHEWLTTLEGKGFKLAPLSIMTGHETVAPGAGKRRSFSMKSVSPMHNTHDKKQHHNDKSHDAHDTHKNHDDTHH